MSKYTDTKKSPCNSSRSLCFRRGFLGLSMLFIATAAVAQSETIRVNQVGLHPNGEKTATIEVASASAKPVTASIVDKVTGKTLWTGKAVRTEKSPFGSKARQIVDFTAFTQPGHYDLVVGKERMEINIDRHALRPLAVAAAKAFYYQRASMPIEEQYAGRWARPAGHPDDNVMVHPSAVSDERPLGTVIASPGGWYDAGDYNKYIVNSGYTVGAMMNAYERCKDYFKQLDTNIPESGNDVPDLLDEIHYNLKWMQTMQDSDGGVYHKLTTPNFEGFVAPTECHQQRYVVKKSTAASLDFAASMAMAARVYKEFEGAFPGFTAKALEQAEKAYAWAQAHPREIYSQMRINALHDPNINTGEYGDSRFGDEFFWAATELYLATGKAEYREEALAHKPTAYTPATWGNVAELGMLDWIIYKSDASASDKVIADEFRDWLLAYLKPFADSAEHSCFVSPAGNRAEDFFWGCNAEGCCWRGVQMMYGYTLTGDKAYLANARRCMNYLLGQNATGYCYVTGFGIKPTAHPHHRLAQTEHGALPGFMAGGPNPGQQDKAQVTYHTAVPDESYEDNTDSYASNEIAINWNATLVALAGWLDAMSAE